MIYLICIFAYLLLLAGIGAYPVFLCSTPKTTIFEGETIVSPFV